MGPGDHLVLYMATYLAVAVAALLLVRTIRQSVNHDQQTSEAVTGPLTADQEPENTLIDDERIICPECGTANEAEPVYLFCYECLERLPHI